jgi:hypothetical protein
MRAHGSPLPTAWRTFAAPDARAASDRGSVVEDLADTRAKT